MQKHWVNADKSLYPAADMTIVAINRLREAFAKSGLPVFHVVMEHAADVSTLSPNETKPWNVKGSDEGEIVAELRPRATELVLFKARYSAFFGTNLLS